MSSRRYDTPHRRRTLCSENSVNARREWKGKGSSQGLGYPTSEDRPRVSNNIAAKDILHLNFPSSTLHVGSVSSRRQKSSKRHMNFRSPVTIAQASFHQIHDNRSPSV